MLRKLYAPIATSMRTRKHDIISTWAQIGAGVGVAFGAKELKQHLKDCPHENPAMLEAAVHLTISAASGAAIAGAGAVAVLEAPTIAMAAATTGAALFFRKTIMKEKEALVEHKARPKL